MAFKFERLEVWQLAIEYVDLIYELSGALPEEEKYNLTSQIRRAATSIALNIAEGSTGQTDAEQARFLGMALRPLLETVACQHLISRRDHLDDPTPLREAYSKSQTLARKLQAFRNSIDPDRTWIREDSVVYDHDDNSERDI